MRALRMRKKCVLLKNSIMSFANPRGEAPAPAAGSRSRWPVSDSRSARATKHRPQRVCNLRYVSASTAEQPQNPSGQATKKTGRRKDIEEIAGLAASLLALGSLGPRRLPRARSPLCPPSVFAAWHRVHRRARRKRPALASPRW